MAADDFYRRFMLRRSLYKDAASAEEILKSLENQLYDIQKSLTDQLAEYQLNIEKAQYYGAQHQNYLNLMDKYKDYKHETELMKYQALFDIGGDIYKDIESDLEFKKLNEFYRQLYPWAFEE